MIARVYNKADDLILTTTLVSDTLYEVAGKIPAELGWLELKVSAKQVGPSLYELIGDEIVDVEVADV